MVTDGLLLIPVSFIPIPLKIRFLLLFLILADMALWIIIYKQLRKWLDFLYFEEGLDIEFEEAVLLGAGWWIPGIFLLIVLIRAKSLGK